MTDAALTRAIVVERVLPHAPEKVWRVLTEAELIGRWLMPNDFRPEIGHRLSFRTRPMGDWDGTVACEVLDCEPPRLLRYRWVGGSAGNSAYGSRLVSVVTWTLTPVAGGTLLHMEHDGFGPGNELAYDAMSGGWARVPERIASLAAELDEAARTGPVA
jgi:uncharacterized protein YndB with AHSA1/START domain